MLSTLRICGESTLYGEVDCDQVLAATHKTATRTISSCHRGYRRLLYRIIIVVVSLPLYVVCRINGRTQARRFIRQRFVLLSLPLFLMTPFVPSVLAPMRVEPPAS